MAWLLAVALLVAGGAAPAQSGGLVYFYCYAPDPASGTVFMSPALPVGPVAERTAYGAEFVAHLKQQGRLRGAAQGYCSMKPSLEAVALAQSRLPKENCAECAGASRFEGVAWNRGGKAAAPPPAVVEKGRDAGDPAREGAAASSSSVETGGGSSTAASISGAATAAPPPGSWSVK